jgi:predicted TPR repeat methyltransferase
MRIMSELNERIARLQKAYDCKSTEELIKYYSEWAPNYQDDEMTLGYDAPGLAATLMNKYLDKNSDILDIGCGTGAVGEFLRIYGFRNIDGLDATPKMLEIAQSKRIYRFLYYLKLRKNSVIDGLDEKYDAIVGCGIFTMNHVKANSLDLVIRWLKPGGLLVFSCTKPSYDKDMKKQLEKMKNKISVIERIEREHINTNHDSFPYTLFVYKKGI